jgi:hypothetical protein
LAADGEVKDSVDGLPRRLKFPESWFGVDPPLDGSMSLIGVNDARLGMRPISQGFAQQALGRIGLAPAAGRMMPGVYLKACGATSRG